MRYKGRFKRAIWVLGLFFLLLPHKVFAAEGESLILPRPEILLKLKIKEQKTRKQGGQQAETVLIRGGADQLVLGNSYQFQTGVYPKTASDVPVVWESSNTFVAAVDQQGSVTAGWEGEAVITVRTTDGTNLSDSKKIKVIKGKVIVLDPGHGGKDSGASSSKYGLTERNMNLDIAMACKEELEQYDGVTVFLTRTTNSSYPSLAARPKMASDERADLFVSLHINDGAFFSGGAEVYQSSSMNFQVTELCRGILRNLSGLGMRNRGVKTRRGDGGKDYYAVIRGSAAYGIPGIIVEHGFINNRMDALKMDTKLKREAMGKADAKAIASYYELSLKKQSYEE